MSLPVPLALTPCLPREVLFYTVQQTGPTIVIVCRPRAAFLSSLLKNILVPETQNEDRQSVQSDPDHEVASIPPEFPMKTVDDDTDQPRQEQPLLIPTLQQISRTRQTNMAYLPTVSHLRAYLSVLPPSPVPLGSSPDGQASKSAHVPLLLIYGLVELHRETSEWSTQGLGITLAAVVDAGSRAGRRVVTVEEWMPESEPTGHYLEGGDQHMSDRENVPNETGRVLIEQPNKAGTWHERLTILSGSARRAEADSEFGGRTVEVGTVMSRWFKFRRGAWDDGSRV